MPAFSSSSSAELWVLLLEKAWSKIYKSYDNIESGLTRESLNNFTGAPTKTLWVSEKDNSKLWETIL